MKRFSLRLPVELHEKLRLESFNTGRSINEIVKELIENKYKGEMKVTMNYRNIESMKKYIEDEITERGLEDGQIEIDFAGLCEEEETIQAAKELGFRAEKGEGQGIWWIYKED